MYFARVTCTVTVDDTVWVLGFATDTPYRLDAGLGRSVAASASSTERAGPAMLSTCFCYAHPVSDLMSPEPLFLRRSDPIEVTRPHRDPKSVSAAARGIFRVNAIGPNVPVRVPPPSSVAFWL
jgi:hypothetical protein